MGGGPVFGKIVAYGFVGAVIYYAISSEFFSANEVNPYLKEERIRVVGSSTVFPFATIAAEYFGKKTGYKTPIIEATGTGGGMQAFCSSSGLNTPDIANASRKIKPSELNICRDNGVKDIIEIPLGHDGLVIAGARKENGIQLNITKKQLFLALAPRLPHNGKLIPNPHKKWSDISDALPNRKIKVLGPPPTSGTRDSFVEMVLEEGCKDVAGAKELGLVKKACRAIREDGHWQDMGENDNLIVQKVNADPDNIGIFGFAYYEENKNVLRAALISGIEPSFATIKDKTYQIARPLFVYVKKDHFTLKPSLRQFAKEFVSGDAAGEFGYLSERGLVPLSRERRKEIRKSLSSKG